MPEVVDLTDSPQTKRSRSNSTSNHSNGGRVVANRKKTSTDNNLLYATTALLSNQATYDVIQSVYMKRRRLVEQKEAGSPQLEMMGLKALRNNVNHAAGALRLVKDAPYDIVDVLADGCTIPHFGKALLHELELARIIR